MRLVVFIFCTFLMVVSTVGTSVAEEERDIFAVWVQPEEEKNTIVQYARMTNGKWEEASKLNINDGLHVTPVIAVDTKKNIWIVWVEQTKDENILRYACVRPKSFETGRVNKAGDEQSYAPAIMIDRDDKPFIAWSGVYGKFADIYSSKWENNTWTQSKRVNEKNESPDITPIIGLEQNKTPWISWLGYVDKYKYVQFLAKFSDNKWCVEKQVLPSKDIKAFINKRIRVDGSFPRQAQKRYMGAVFVGATGDIQSISERFVSFNR